MKVTPSQRMWRTLVVVDKVWKPDGVVLEIPAVLSLGTAFCPRKAIPPAIYDTMEVGKRYHVECNIGAERVSDICFDRWEEK